MKTGDHEHPLVGRIRAWDGLIILHRLPVSPLPFTSHLFSSPLPSLLVVSVPDSHLVVFYPHFSLIERVDSLTHSLSILIS